MLIKNLFNINIGIYFILLYCLYCSSWESGLLFNGTADFTSPIDKCEFWSKFMRAIKDYNYRLGGGPLIVADDNDQLDPCR